MPDAPSPFPDHYSDQAEAYARHRPAYPDELVDTLAATLRAAAPEAEGPPALPDEPEGTVWEAGCGSGQLSVPLARRFARVLATDASRGQIDQGRPHPRVSYRCAPAEASGLPDGCADLTVAAQAAHWFDLDAYWREVRRVARPGGLAALVSYGTPVMDGEAGRLLARFYREELAPWWPPQRAHVETGYRDLPFPFPEVAPRVPDGWEPALVERWSRARVLGYVGTWSAVRALERARGPEAFERFRDAVREAWADGEARAIRWPLAVRAGRIG